MESNYIKNKYYLKSKMSNFFYIYKYVLCICLLFLVLGIILGFWAASKYSSDIELDNMLNTGISDMLKGDKSGISLFWLAAIKYLLSFCIVFFCCRKNFLNIFIFVLLIINGYYIAFDVTILIFEYGLIGILNVVIFILPFQVLIWGCLVLICCITIKKNCLENKYGCFRYNYPKICCVLLCVGILGLLLKYLCLPALRITIIVN